MKLTPLEHIAAQRRIIEFYGFPLSSAGAGPQMGGTTCSANTRHTVVHGDFRAGNFIVAKRESAACWIGK